MSHAKARRRKAGYVLALLTLLLSSPSHAETVLFGGERLQDANLVACQIDAEGGSATLEINGERRETERLVRWGEPAPVERRTTIVLADGSRLLSDREWSPIGLVRIEGDSVRLRRGEGWVEFPRESVRWVVLDAEAAGLRLGAIPTEADESSDDVVLLAEGDRIAGRVSALGSDKLTITVGGEPIETPLASVAAVRFAGGAGETDPACLVGWSDGSLLRAERLTVSDGIARAESGEATVESAADKLVFVQPLNTAVRYLSDLEPVDYRHTPYLDLVWPYARDENLRGGPLAGAGIRRAKGLATHSAARLIYRLDGAASRFRADLAIGDPPVDSTAEGSVIFRVYLVKDGEFVPAYESGVVRAGDAPEPIDIDLEGAAALALIVDYADAGDAGDEALWLDARLEPAPPGAG